MSLANPDRVRFYNDNPWPATKDGTEMASEGSESAQSGSQVDAPLFTLSGLSERDLWVLNEALISHRKLAPVGMDYRHVDTLKAKIVDQALLGPFEPDCVVCSRPMGQICWQCA